VVTSVMDTSTPFASQEALRALLRELIEARGESLREFGATLARVIDPDARPFTRAYIIALRDGKRRITPKISHALFVLAAMEDGASELQARARKVQVWAVHDLPPDAIVLGKARRCALPGCRTTFVPVTPNQRYCSRECRQEMRRRRRSTRG